MRQLRWVSRAAVLAALLVLAGASAGMSQAAAGPSGVSGYQVGPGTLNGTHPHFQVVAPKGGIKGHARMGISGIDSITNWSDHYFASGIGPTGLPQFEWYTNTVGNPPNMHGTTTFNAPIIPVTVSLRDANGNQAFFNGQPLISSPAQYVEPTLESPVFQNSTYSSSPVPTQFTDAVQRAEYFGQEKSDWHTLLAPSVKTGRQLNVPFGSYEFAPNSDGTCCAFILMDENAFINGMFPPTSPPDNSTVIGQAEVSGDITTKDISTFLFPNTFLYENGNPSECCVLGFHTYDFENGDASNGNRQRDYVVNYSSWISPGLFGARFSDITALSHEIAETYNDPFVASDGLHNITPWWLAPQGNCQDNRETGDVIEDLSDATFPMTMNGFTYHPQNEALLQYFEFQQPSTAIDGAYSYPNESVLTGPSAPQNAGCQ